MAADYSRIHRLLKILTLIQGSKGWTTKRLSLECGVTERTIYRDLTMLEGAGIPYFFDEESGGYAVRRDFFMPPVQLTLDETLALAALAEHIGGKEQVPFTKAAGKAITKIRSLLPPSIRTELEQIEDRVQIKLAAANPPEAAADVYEIVRTALSKKLVLRCQYDSASSNSDKSRTDEVFLFKPYALLFNQRAWYVIGHHGKRDEVRCLKLNRFTMTKLTDVNYSIPKAFSLQKHLGNAWRMIRGKKTYDVELRFDKEFADTIADTHWHSTQEVLYNDDESITFRCKVDGLEEIVWWVLSMGPHCVVKQPKELAEKVKELALGIARCYSSE
jgi:proteasome accessory factor B